MLVLILLFILIVGLDCHTDIKEYHFQSEKIKKKITLLHLSDLHSQIDDRTKKCLNEDVDYIIISGDLIDKNRKAALFLDTLKQLEGNKNIIFVSGNHEYRNQDLSFEKIKALLIKQGCHVLDNECLSENGLNIIGISDYFQFENDELNQEYHLIKLVCNNIKFDNAFNLAIIHRPQLYYAFEDYPIDLLLSGHAHGGQWRIPFFINGLFAPQQGIFPKRAGGLYPLKHGTQIVSRGLARYIWLPRFFNRPEIIRIVIDKK